MFSLLLVPGHSPWQLRFEEPITQDRTKVWNALPVPEAKRNVGTSSPLRDFQGILDDSSLFVTRSQGHKASMPYGGASSSSKQ